KDAGRRRTGRPVRGGGAPGAASTDRSARPQRPNQRSRRQMVGRDEIYNGAQGRNRKRRVSSRKGAKTQLTRPAAHKRVVRVDGTISVGELAKAMSVKGNEVLAKLIQLGVMCTLNQQIDAETCALVATEYEYEIKDVAFDEDEVLSSAQSDAEIEKDPDALPRSPIVTVMGHVDHGKTTLLDHIRNAQVAAGEAGGITQHIAAYRVKAKDGNELVFLDTPGHAAFTAMRARGASITDLIVLVVAADDGVMPQTVESINHARAAGVPLIVAINKLDKPGVDPERIKQELTKYNLVSEEWGGETMFVNISALKGTNIDALLEALALQAEILELKANPKKEAFGTVLEARIDKGRGSVCTIIVQEGTLKSGDYVVTGQSYGRVRALIDDRGKRIKEAGPATPVEVLGLNAIPAAGDTFHVVANERDAKKVVSRRDTQARAAVMDNSRRTDAGVDLLAAMGKPAAQRKAFILKTDVAGSLEALKATINDISNDEVEVHFIHTGVGQVNESDITLAQAAEATVLAFNVGADAKAKRAADQAGIKILTHKVIYEIVDLVKDLLSGMLTPDIVESFLGRAEVRAVFSIKTGQVAGCYVQEGKILRNARARVFRGGNKVYEGKLITLKRFKDDVREVNSGYECGLSIDGYKEIAEGDIVEVFELKEVRRKLGDS
ncbi:translation initiation factor IF-2, partial [Myxococcota bacterium]|nr:translation initiation factor IF-2 [Myxococcota bacterium]MBU1896555.1 translation initiation factor IF-2 [Myxococcota bacterium]